MSRFVPRRRVHGESDGPAQPRSGSKMSSCRSHGFRDSAANGLAFDATRSNLYVANTGDDRIFRIARQPRRDAVRYDLRGTEPRSTRLITRPARSMARTGIVFDASGRLWVCANQANEIQSSRRPGRSW